MKKVIATILVITGVISAQAQTAKNDWMVGGSFRLNTSDNNTQIGFSPSAGLFILDNLALGGNLGVNYTKFGDAKSTSFNIGPFVRYYFTTESQAVRPILQGTFNFLTTKQTAINFSTTNTGINFFVGGGAAMFISENVSIDALVGYDRTKIESQSGRGGFAFNVGFQVYLLKGKVKK
ncbi:MAG: outer membrane beta-barrel protein [Bacteroidetes bacterium]|nr:outer membrane beta-barrel protein [Bacteroidota bacterium]